LSSSVEAIYRLPYCNSCSQKLVAHNRYK